MMNELMVQSSLSDIKGILIFFHKKVTKFLFASQTLQCKSPHHLHFKAEHAFNL